MRPLLPAALVAALLTLTACSSEEPAPSDAATRAGDVAWSPCDGLTAESVSDLVGEEVTQQTGTAQQQRCTFTPVAESGAAYDVNYQPFDGGLNEALESMGAAGTQLRAVEVPDADAARIAVRERRSGVIVSGFVQTGGLVQSVNAVQLKPYDRRAVVAGTTALLGELAAQAPDEKRG